MKKAYFQYYETFETIIEKIKDIEEREWLRKVIINYGLHGLEPDTFFSEALEIAWTICKDLIDQQHHRREVNAANRAGKKAEPATNEEKSAAAASRSQACSLRQPGIWTLTLQDPTWSETGSLICLPAETQEWRRPFW